MMSETDYMIAVITRGRINQQIFINSIPEVVRGVITIVCHPGEGDSLRRLYGKQVNGVIEYGGDCKNLSDALDWLMRYCRRKRIRYVVRIDDNIYIGARSDQNSVISFDNKLLNVRNNFSSETQARIITKMFSWILTKLRQGYGCAGISHRSGNNRKTNQYDENARLFALFGIDVEKYFSCGYRFNDIPCKQDFLIQLAMLTRGYKTICNNCYTFDKRGGANAEGGCSIYRTINMINSAGEYLKKHFPDFVTLVDKSNSNWSNIDSDKRVEVIIHWKKAYNSSLK